MYRTEGRSGRRLVIAAVLGAVALTACGERVAPEPGGATASPESPGNEARGDSFDGTWELTEGRGPSGPIEPPRVAPVTLSIEGTQVGGTASCNYYSGDARIDGNSFALDGGGMTEMACDAKAMDAESKYIAALHEANEIHREGNLLTLTGPDSELRFRLLPPVPTAELTDTRWELESLIEGTGDEGTAMSAEPAHLTLHSDGTLSGTTGCREISGEWDERNGEIMFGTFGAEGECPARLEEQDSHVVTVLGDGFRAEVDGQMLLVSSRGLGLHYRAASD